MDNSKAQVVQQLVKEALESLSPERLTDFLNFACRFQRMAVFNTRMIYIQRPGATAIASEYEWKREGRHVLPDAVPIIILWPFSPIKFVYELADTGPPIEREDIGDPFAVEGTLENKNIIKTISANINKEKSFEIVIEPRRQGFAYAGSASAHGHIPNLSLQDVFSDQGKGLNDFSHGNCRSSPQTSSAKFPKYRITINDRLNEKEKLVTLAHELGHIFCGHLGKCRSSISNENSGWPDRRGLGVNEREIEAEAVTYLVSKRAGLHPESAKYLHGYAKEADLSLVNMDLIISAAGKIERLAKLNHGSISFEEK